MATVLVAENSSPADSISSILTRRFGSEYTIRQATNPWEFFRFLWDHPLEIVFLNMELPGIDPKELLRSLKNGEQSRKNLPAAESNSAGTLSQENMPSILDFTGKPYTEAQVILAMEETLHHRSLLSGGRSVPPATSDLTRIDLVKPKIQQYIQEHYGDILSMQDVARVMNYSDTHFCRLFKQCFQVNFSVYLNEYRVEQAKKLLLTSNLAIKEVGTACGYRDTSYFIRVFKRHTGATPSDYRTREVTKTARKSDKS